MKGSKKVLAGILTAAMSISSLGMHAFASAGSPVDVDGTRYEEPIQILQALDIMNGDGDIYFNAYRIECDGDTQGKHGMAVFCPYGKFNTPSKFQFIKDYV